MAEHRTEDTPGPDPCPTWCTRRHTRGDHPGDHLHQSPPRYAPVVTGRPWLGGRPPDATTLVARLVRQPGGVHTWLEVTGEEDDAVRLCLTAESARELVVLLESLLALTGT